MSGEKSFAPKAPDYNLGALDKETGERSIIGCAWSDESTGRIRIRLNPFIVLASQKSILLTLFPNEDRRPKDEENENGTNDGGAESV